jgi:peptide chain release factor subunit 1
MQVDRIRQFANTTFPVLSLYVNRVGTPRERTSTGAKLSELLRPIREMAESGRLSHEAAMSLRADLKAVQGMADRIDADPAPAVAIFTCHGADWFEHVSLNRPAWDVTQVGNRPYLRPLRAAETEFRSAAVVFEPRRSVVFIKTGDEFREAAEIVEEAVRKSNYGGFGGYEERGVRSHAEAVVQRHFKETADLIFRLHQETGFDFVFLGGHQEAIDEGSRLLHPYLKTRIAGSFVIDTHTMTPALVREHVVGLEEAAIASLEASRVQELLDTAGAGGQAVLGITDVLAAVNARAIDRLIVSGNFSKEGSVCESCGWLSRNGTNCPVCGSGTRPTDDVVGEIIEATIDESGEVLQVSISSALDQKAIGAVLRFPLPEGMS